MAENKMYKFTWSLWGETDLIAEGNPGKAKSRSSAAIQTASEVRKINALIARKLDKVHWSKVETKDCDDIDEAHQKYTFDMKYNVVLTIKRINNIDIED